MLGAHNMKNVSDDTECPICLSNAGQHLITGCDHMFCKACIQTWCCDHRAYCPMCEQPIYGLQSTDELEFFLTPHFGEFGLTLEGNDSYTRVKGIQRKSVAEIVGLQPKSLVCINGEHSLQKSIGELRTALSQRRFVNVSLKPSKNKTDRFFGKFIDRLRACLCSL